MQYVNCYNCGETVKLAGSVCGYCGADKAPLYRQDRANTVFTMKALAAGVGGGFALGLIEGMPAPTIYVFAAICTLPFAFGFMILYAMWRWVRSL